MYQNIHDLLADRLGDAIQGNYKYNSPEFKKNWLEESDVLQGMFGHLPTLGAELKKLA